ncbi:glycosyltransferase [Amycolatopsis sp. NPDC023774]|uniref:glycosyltransferase n=1 Tax=Amycolatopsis sp. NPDC023774 TaxID=3155015 RepID=UPI00340D1B24
MRIAFVTETWLPSTDGIVTRLVATVRELHARGHDVLVIAPEAGGPSALAGARVRTVRAAGAKFRTVFTGMLHGDALAEAYRTADLFVFPSTTDTLGLVLLEALASGLPVLAVESPAARSTLAGTTAAEFFPIDRTADLPAHARALLSGDHRAEARRHAAGSGWDTATEHLLALYTETLSSAGRCRTGAVRRAHRAG